MINGAAGGVCTLAVQIAESSGAEVTGVCSTRNVEMDPLVVAGGSLRVELYIYDVRKALVRRPDL